jgi:Protein of unknown function (DUF3606)
MARNQTAVRPNRSWIDVSNKEIVKRWAKRLGKTQEEVLTAIEKVGSNAETVAKELRD